MTEEVERVVDDDEISVLDILIVLAKHKLLILGVPFAAGVLSILYSLSLPNIYTSTARVLPPQRSMSPLVGNLGGFAAQSLGVKSQSELYVGMLQSRTVADNLIRRFDLQKLYAAQTMGDARTALAGRTAVRTTREGIISIDVDDKDPKRAADLANAYVVELDNLMGQITVSEAGQRRVYYERQLKLTKEQLAEAEVALRKTQEQTGMIQLQEQGRAIIDAVAQLRAQIAAKEVQLSAMRTFATASNPDYLRVSEELSGLRSELNKLEKGSPGSPTNALIPTGSVPGAGLEFVRKLREVKYHETLFELIAKQYEIARAEESRDGGVVQVVDAAVPPERKSKPRRATIVIMSVLASAFMAVVAAFAMEALERARRNPASSTRMEQLRHYLSWRRRKRI